MVRCDARVIEYVQIRKRKKREKTKQSKVTKQAEVAMGTMKNPFTRSFCRSSGARSRSTVPCGDGMIPHITTVSRAVLCLLVHGLVYPTFSSSVPVPAVWLRWAGSASQDSFVPWLLLHPGRLGMSALYNWIISVRPVESSTRDALRVCTENVEQDEMIIREH